MLWITVPTGMLASGRALPGRISTFLPEIRVSPTLMSSGADDVALVAIHIEQQGNARRAVRVVLDGRDLGRDIQLIALEIDHAIVALGAAAAMADGDGAG